MINTSMETVTRSDFNNEGPFLMAFEYPAARLCPYCHQLALVTDAALSQSGEMIKTRCGRCGTQSWLQREPQQDLARTYSAFTSKLAADKVPVLTFEYE